MTEAERAEMETKIENAKVLLGGASRSYRALLSQRSKFEDIAISCNEILDVNRVTEILNPMEIERIQDTLELNRKTSEEMDRYVKLAYRRRQEIEEEIEDYRNRLKEDSDGND